MKGLPLLEHTNLVDKGDFIVSPSGKKMSKWYSNANGKERSKTFPGIANAFAEQWGS